MAEAMTIQAKRPPAVLLPIPDEPKAGRHPEGAELAYDEIGSGGEARRRAPGSDSLRFTHRILVAEDNLVNSRLISRQLAKLGFESEIVENGRRAVEACAGAGYAAVLMDCQMPEMDGFEATVRIRRQESGRRRIPIIALTASAFTGDRERCLAAGMDDYLSKPLETGALARVLERWTARADRNRMAAAPSCAQPAAQTDSKVPDP